MKNKRRLRSEVISAICSTFTPWRCSRSTWAWMSRAGAASSSTLRARSMRPGMSWVLPATRPRMSMSSRKPAHSPSRRTATRRLSCLVISSTASNTKSSASTEMTSKWQMSRTGVPSGIRRSTAALERFMPVTTPVRSPSRTKSTLPPLSAMRWPACSMVASASMNTAGMKLASRTLARSTLSTPPSALCASAKALSFSEISE